MAIEEPNLPHRVEWSEVRIDPPSNRETYFIIAERINGQWRFYERSTWEIRWYEVPPNQELLSSLRCHLR